MPVHNPKSKIQNPKSEGILTDCDVLTIQDLLELHGAEDPLLRVLLACLFAELNRGSLCLKIPGVTYSSVLEDLGATAFAGAIQDKLLGADWHDLIGEPGCFTPLIRVPSGLSGDFLCLYFQRYYEYERRVREQIEGRIKAPPAAISTRQACEAVREVLALPLPPPRRGTGLFAGDGAATVNWELADAQKAALALALRQRFLIISGGPGTGKTTSVLTILRCLARLGCQPQRMLLAAPTGRAAYRLTDSIRGGLRALQESAGALPKPDDALLGLEACTIHRLLQYRPSRHDFAHHAGNPLQADVIVIDEVSMVDAGLMASLLEALPPEARLIFLGDKDQLPSVEAGAMLADLIPQTEAPNYSADTAQWVRTVAQVQWPPLPSPPAGEGGVRVPQGEPQDHVVVLTQNYRVADTNIVEAVKCLTGLPSQKAIEAGLFAKRAFPQPVGDAEDDSKTLSCLWPADAPGATGYHFIELTPEWASRGHWSRLLQSWAWHHYLRSAGFQPAPRGEGGRSYRDLLLQAAAQADFHRFDCISPELARDILSCVRNAQILTILRHGRFGCTRVNAVLMQYLAPKLDRYPAPGWFSGLPILITRNDYEMNLFNGDSGVILRDRNGLYRALFERRQLSAGIECLALDRLPPWEPALAITVHKSQGSEYAEVLLVVPPADAAETPAEELPAPRLLTAEILYTGLTRARRLALLCGTKSVVMQAATRRVERASGLAQGRHEGMKDEG